MPAFAMRGVLIGLVFGVPLGAVGALCLQRSLEKGFWHGLATGLGSSAADCLYACAGLCGLNAVTAFLQRHELAVTALGSLLIAVYGAVSICKVGYLPSAAPSAVPALPAAPSPWRGTSGCCPIFSRRLPRPCATRLLCFLFWRCSLRLTLAVQVWGKTVPWCLAFCAARVRGG